MNLRFNFLITIALLTSLLSGCRGDISPNHRLVDTKATAETKALYERLFTLREKGTMVSHQDDLAYGHAWYGEAGRSDVKDVTGDYPPVLGLEIGHVEIGAAHNLDSVYFRDMKRYIRETYDRGGLTTISWHANNIVTGGSTWDAKLDYVVKSLLPGNESHEQFLTWLDRVAEFMLDQKGANGELIPIVFRLYHEHNAGWFWWGDQNGVEDYVAMWRMTVEYLRDTKQVHNLIYAFSPNFCANEAEYLERYPGDQYVDVVGFDGYFYGEGEQAMVTYRENMRRNMEIVDNYAAKSGKLPIVAETGMESVPYPTYFTEIIYPLVSQYKPSWILFWRNAWELDKPNHYYMPFLGHPSAEDLVKFVDMPEILMTKELQQY